MPKNSLQAALSNINESSDEETNQSHNKKKPSRQNTILIGGHFPPKVNQQLKMIAVEEMTTNQALLEEALDLLFIKKGKEKISNL